MLTSDVSVKQFDFKPSVGDFAPNK